MTISDIYQYIYDMLRTLSNDMISQQEITCTLCQHPLNNVLYQIHSHPTLNVALCIECHNDLETKQIQNKENNISNEDVCQWCLDGGHLFLCDQCEHGYCDECIENNFSELYVNEIDNSNSWKCFDCNKRLIESHVNNMKALQEQSIYNEDVILRLAIELESANIGNTVSMFGHEEYIFNGENVYYDVCRLRLILQGREEVSDMLTEDKFDQFRQEIRNELIESQATL